MRSTLLSITIAAGLSLFTLQMRGQVYDHTIYEVGSNAGISFESDGWAFDLVATDLFYTSITNVSNTEEFYLYWFNDFNPFTATSTRAIPPMANYTDVEISLNFTDLNEPEDSVFLYTSNDFINWDLLGQWGSMNGGISATTTFTNVNDEYVKVELKGTVPSGGWHYYFSDFVVKVDTTNINVGISDNIVEDHRIYSYDDKIRIEANNNDKYEVVIYNLKGQVIYSETASGNKEILLTIPQGVYIVNLTSKGNSITERVMIR